MIYQTTRSLGGGAYANRVSSPPDNNLQTSRSVGGGVSNGCESNERDIGKIGEYYTNVLRNEKRRNLRVEHRCKFHCTFPNKMRNYMLDFDFNKTRNYRSTGQSNNYKQYNQFFCKCFEQKFYSKCNSFRLTPRNEVVA